MAGPEDRPIDVLICGGGLAGLLLALQLRQAQPGLGVVVVERTERPLPDACHKVGESSVELGSQYLERLGLTDYLHRRHLLKFALRFFPGGGRLPLEQRTEIGANGVPVVRSYQMDRGRLETDLRAMVTEAGAQLIEGAVVKQIDLQTGGAPHAVSVQEDGQRRKLVARWVIDATGRAALLRRKTDAKRGVDHPASAGWFRIEGRLNINSLVAPDDPWQSRPYADQRWRSTNHLMGDGYWAWIIPLATGHTSIGVVVHHERHGFDDVRTLARTQAFLANHEPVLAEAVQAHRVMDFGCIKGYSNNVAQAWSADRWGMVGEAGAFVDPLYSPGTDYIALANAITGELIATDVAGGDLAARVAAANRTYRALIDGAVDVFRHAGPVYGHARAMAAKIYWDNFNYWNYPCQYFQQRIYRLEGDQHEAFGPIGQRFVSLSNHVQRLMRAWALLSPAPPTADFRPMPGFPSLLVDSHLALQDTMTAEETLAYMRRRAVEGEQIVAELVLRAVQEVGPDIAPALLAQCGFHEWGIAITPQRLASESLRGLKRRHSLSPIARDVERTLGRVNMHPEAAKARALLAT